MIRIDIIIIVIKFVDVVSSKEQFKQNKNGSLECNVRSTRHITILIEWAAIAWRVQEGWR